MFLGSYLDRWDERQAAEDEPRKPLKSLVVDAPLAFGEAGEAASVAALVSLAKTHAADAAAFYSAKPVDVRDFRFENGVLTFPSAISTETESNNIVHARVYEAKRRGSAIVILPHWNASMWDYASFGGHFARLGLTAVELCLPYHGVRNRSDAPTSDYFLSANLGRTIRSVRQAVLDTRGVLDWLEGRGYQKLGLIGTSLGSCVGGLVAAHDPRVHASALLLTAGDFGEVVWTGRATQHIQAGLAPEMSLSDLREAWSIISTGSYAEELSRADHDLLILSGTRDRVVLPDLTRRFAGQLQDFHGRHTWQSFPCGHYSLALFPFNILAFLALLRFFGKSGMLGRAASTNGSGRTR